MLATKQCTSIKEFWISSTNSMQSYQATLIGLGTSLQTPTADGTNGQVMVTNGAGVLSFATASGASPGGTGTNLQYRVDGTTFGGVTGSVVSGSTIGINVTPTGQFHVKSNASTVITQINEGAVSQSVDMHQWNPAGVTAGTRAKINSVGEFSCNYGGAGSEFFGMNCGNLASGFSLTAAFGHRAFYFGGGAANSA